MKTSNQKAFTMVELIFVIVIIGILSAVAVPKFSGTVKKARMTKAGAVLSSVRSALATERQRRILRGKFISISDLGEGSYAFSYFDGNTSGRKVLQYPVKNCVAGTSTACWDRDSTVDPKTYTYRFPQSGDAKFKLENNNLICDDTAADCAELE
jgi:general secretion pathway protein G